MLRVLSQKHKNVLGLIDEKISTLELQHVENSEAGPVMSLSQDPAPMPAKVERAEAQNQDLYRQNLQMMVISDRTW